MKHFYANGGGTSFSIPIYKSRYLSDFHKSGVVTLLICLFSFHFVCFAQESRESGATGKGVEVKEVSIGHKVPDDFWKREHLFFINGDTTRKSLLEYQGKMLVLDFWFSGCSPCLLPQNKIKEYVERYNGKLAVVLVSSKKTKDSFERLKTLYEKGFFKKFGLESFESIILDDYLSSLFPYSAFPQYVWINEHGMLQLRTYQNLLDKDYLAPFIDLIP